MQNLKTSKRGYYRTIRHLISLNHWEDLQEYFDGLAGDVQNHLKKQLKITGQAGISLFDCESPFGNGVIGIGTESGERPERGILALKAIAG
jgi:hypothetical protein